MNDIKDIRENPDKYRKGLSDRGQDPTQIDELIRVDKGARIAKTLVQNRQSQANIDTQLWELYAVTRKKPLTEEQKEQQAAALKKKLETLQEEARTLELQLNEWQQDDLQREIEYLDRKIAVEEAKIAECDRKQTELLAPFASVLEEIVEEIKQKDYFLQKGRGEGSISRFSRYGNP
jgi:seryl-tRNA synthetase